ncbi:hypothetical protein AX14_014438 [Amanita brunnescens Koide BX004]|nr:hypothetical protein AX14_014438 [Amanita brunnescens Koide BX004]
MSTYAQVIVIAPLTMAIHATSAVIDVVLSFALVALLHWSLTGLNKSESMITRMANTFHCELTSFCAIAALAGIAASPMTRIYVAFYFCLGRLYTNSLLAVLNSRRTLIRIEGGADGTAGLQFTSVQSNL